jgi:hypothetical protein
MIKAYVFTSQCISGMVRDFWAVSNCLINILQAENLLTFRADYFGLAGVL